MVQMKTQFHTHIFVSTYWIGRQIAGHHGNKRKYIFFYVFQSDNKNRDLFSHKKITGRSE